MCGAYPLLAVRDLRICLKQPSPTGELKYPVKCAHLTVERLGQVVCVVGESGSGKTTLCHSLLGLLNGLPGIVEGTIEFRGKTVRSERGELLGQVGIVMQEARSSLNPFLTVGASLKEGIQKIQVDRPRKWREFAEQLLTTLYFPSGYLDKYPHQLSEGQCRLVAVAIALIQDPLLLIADEPFDALDPLRYEAVASSLSEWQARGRSTVLVTHHWDAVRQWADHVVVMFQGYTVEMGPKNVFWNAESRHHPYTDVLIAASQGQTVSTSFPRFANPLEQVSDNMCPFLSRCQFGTTCIDGLSSVPPRAVYGNGHWIRCFI